jgi:hypothetical protein
MLIAQALAEDLAIISSDARFAAYKRLQVLWDQLEVKLSSSTAVCGASDPEGSR